MDSGLKLKVEGMDRAEENNQPFVDLMRKTALLILARKGEVTTDDLRDYAETIGTAPASPQAWGTVLRGKHFKNTGRRVPSRYPSNHNRHICVYELGEI